MLVHHLGDCTLITAGDNTRLREILHPAKQDLKLGYSLAHATIAPGLSSLPHRLRTSEVYYILTGSGLMHIDAELAPVGAGDTIYIPPDSVQFISNTGDADLVFLCIVDPAWRPEDEEILS